MTCSAWLQVKQQLEGIITAVVESLNSTKIHASDEDREEAKRMTQLAIDVCLVIGSHELLWDDLYLKFTEKGLSVEFFEGILPALWHGQLRSLPPGLMQVIFCIEHLFSLHEYYHLDIASCAFDLSELLSSHHQNDFDTWSSFWLDIYPLSTFIHGIMCRASLEDSWASTRPVELPRFKGPSKFFMQNLQYLVVVDWTIGLQLLQALYSSQALFWDLTKLSTWIEKTLLLAQTCLKKPYRNRFYLTTLFDNSAHVLDCVSLLCNCAVSTYYGQLLTKIHYAILPPPLSAFPPFNNMCRWIYLD